MGHTYWLKYCRHYAKQLRSEGLIHKAVVYLLYTHDIETAIKWLKEENLYRLTLNTTLTSGMIMLSSGVKLSSLSILEKLSV